MKNRSRGYLGGSFFLDEAKKENGDTVHTKRKKKGIAELVLSCLIDSLEYLDETLESTGSYKMDHTSITEASELLTRFISPVITGETGGYLFPRSFFFCACGQTNSAGSRKDGDIWRNRRTHWRRMAEPRPEESELISSGESHWFDNMEKLGESNLGKTGQNQDWRIGKEETKEKAQCDRNQSRILPVATLRMRGCCQVRAGLGTGNITINYTYYTTAVVLLRLPHYPILLAPLPLHCSCWSCWFLPHRHADVTSTENNPWVTSLCSLGLYLPLTTTFFPL